jgi:hypothetical protein
LLRNNLGNSLGNKLWNDDGIAGLKLDVLRHVLAFAYRLVIKGQPGFAACSLPENINRFFLGEIAEATSQSDGVKHGRTT